jgi:tRNA modification GTPase
LTKSDLLKETGVMPGLATSAATGQGIETLRLAIAAALRESLSEGEYSASTGARCRESLRAASAALASASKALSVGLGDELVSVDLRLAIDELGKVVGAVVTDDILDRIFRRFCIGK